MEESLEAISIKIKQKREAELSHIANVLTKFFPEETEIGRHKEVRGESFWTYFSFNTPDGNEYRLWDHREYGYSWGGIVFAGKTKDNDSDIFLFQSSTISLSEMLAEKNYVSYKGDGLSFPFVGSRFWFYKFIAGIKDVLPVIRATRTYSEMIEEGSFQDKIGKLKAVRKFSSAIIRDLSFDIEDYIEDYCKKFR